MPATSTNTASKPKTKTSAKSKAKTRIEPDTQTAVRPTVQRAVNAYAKADACMQSKLWPLVEEALDLFDEPMDFEDVKCQFRMAFAMAHRIKPGELDKNPEYHRFIRTSLDVTRVASLGREMVEKNHQEGVGFWKLLDYANDKHAKDGDLDFGAKAKKPEPPPQPAKSAASAATHKRNGKSESEEEEEAEPRAKSGTIKVPRWTPKWSEDFRHIVLHEQEGLIEDLEFCCARGWLPTDEDWLALAKHILLGEKEN
jgi:hypothetical protein